MKNALLKIKSEAIEYSLNKLAKLSFKKQRKWAYDEMPGPYKTNIKQAAKLSETDRTAIKKLWGRLGIYPNEKLMGIIKAECGGVLDPHYVSDDIFFPYILRSLNPQKYAGAYEFKGMYNRLFPNIATPETIINCINGISYDNEGNILKTVQIKDLLYNNSFIIKQSCDSCQGKNVKIVKFVSESDIESITNNYGDNYIVQKICSQSEITKKFSNNSLNTFRITTLYINGRFSVLNILFRCGRGNSVVDNGGAGGLMCGAKEDGSFMEYAFDKELNRYAETDNGVIFKGKVIPELKEIISLIENNAIKNLPLCGIAGWDFALDENNNPVMIEVNLGGSLGIWPGIFYEQLCSKRPLFGERTDEVIEYVRNNPPKLDSIIMSRALKNI